MSIKKISLFLISILSLSIVLSGCSYLEDTGNEEYIETAQESAPDNEDLKEYIEHLKPVIEKLYEDKGELKSIGVKGNSVLVEVDLGESPEPYDDFKNLMVYETTRITSAIYSYREDNPVLDEIYKVSIDFTNQKNITLYGKQREEIDGKKEFSSGTILNAVKN
ncbi:MAG: hypothetical protein GX752_03470 [Clostridium sp.]|nr:hypothetical protein [Clostridium sp.]